MEVALWDLAGKAWGVPCRQLLVASFVIVCGYIVIPM